MLFLFLVLVTLRCFLSLFLITLGRLLLLDLAGFLSLILLSLGRFLLGLCCSLSPLSLIMCRFASILRRRSLGIHVRRRPRVTHDWPTSVEEAMREPEFNNLYRQTYGGPAPTKLR